MVRLLVLVLTAAVAVSGVPATDKTVGADCTINSYNDVSRVVGSCTNIVLNGISVPGGKTLDLGLKSGTSVTIKGTVKFEHSEWDGPLIQITGSNIHVNGAGATLDGQGAKYWDGQGDKGKPKPKFFKIKATGGSTFDNIHLLNCPHQCVSISSSNQVTLSGWNVDVSAGDHNALGHNTDGFDVSDSDGVTIKNSVVKNQDDCVAVNGGKNYHFSGLTCSGGHGLSLSVGQSKTDSNKNHLQSVTFSDCTVSNSRNGIHVKTHTDAASGYIKDVTYSNIRLSGITNYGINVQQDYKGGSSTGNPGNNIPISNLRLQGVTGSMTGSNSVPVYILCGSSGCSNFPWSGISITGGHKSSSCNFHPSGFNC